VSLIDKRLQGHGRFVSGKAFRGASIAVAAVGDRTACAHAARNFIGQFLPVTGILHPTRFARVR
jgi:hypothetical protein